MDFRTLFVVFYIAIAGGAIGVLGKLALPIFEPISLIAFRVIVSVLFLSIFLYLRGSLHKTCAVIWERRGWFVALAFVGIGAGMILGFMGLKKTTAIQYDLLFNLSPLFMVLFATLFLAEHMGKRGALLFGVALIGTYILITQGGNLSSIGSVHLLGDALVLLAGAGWGLYSVGAALAKKHDERLDGFTIAYGSFLVSSVIFLPVLFLFPPDLSGGSEQWMGAMLSALLLAVASTAILFVLWFLLIQKRGGILAALVGLSENVGGVLFPIFILGEHMTWATAIGGSMILGAILCNELKGHAAPTSNS